jgi:hypothetical protein
VPDTHCEPSGSLGTDELAVPNLTASTITTVTPSAGFGVNAIRGVVVLCHFGFGAPPISAYPIPLTNAIGLNEQLTFANQLAADGWVVLYPSYQEDWSPLIPLQAVYNDVANDSGFGSRYLASTLHWWNHVIRFIQTTYPPGFPVVTFGFSEGAYRSMLMAAQFPGQLIAAGGHCPVTLWETPSLTYSGSISFGLLNWSGLDLGPTALNGVTIPMIIGYGTSDNAIGYGGTSTYSGSTINVNTLTGSATVGLASATNYIAGPNVVVTGLTGGTSNGRAVFNFGSISGNNLLNCQLISGSGSMTNGLTITQQNTLAIIANAGSNVVGRAVAENHFFTTADATYYSGTWFVNVVDPLAPKVF